MNKTFTLVFMILFTICCSADAQQVLFTENFNAYGQYTITNGWTQDNITTNPWRAGLPYLIGGICFTPPGDLTSYSNIAGFVDQTCTIDNSETKVFLYSKPITYNSGAWLIYDSYFLKATANGKTESAVVVVTGDNGTTWNTIQQVPAYSGGFKRYYLKMPTYVNAPNVRVGFNYSDMGESMRGWMIDNVKVFVPARKDLEFTRLTPDDTLLCYAPLNHFITLGGTVTNMGTDTVTSFVVKYQETGAPVVTDTISNIVIPPFEQYDFTDHIPYTITSIGLHHINMWTELSGDTNTANNYQSTNIRGVYFMPVKKLVAELGTHVKHGYSPRSYYYMDSLQKLARMQDDDVSIVSIHTETDPMEAHDYQDYIFNLNQYYIPYFLFDRRTNADPDSFFSIFNKQKKHFGFADVDLDTHLSGNQLIATVTVKPAIDLIGDYRAVVAITENDVMDTSSSYKQENYYAGGFRGPMGGYENLPNPVPATDMHYNFVARTIYPAPGGLAAYLPLSMLYGNSYSVTYGIPLNASWDVTKLQAVAMLVRNSDSTILNSNHTTAPLSIAGVPAVFNNVTLFPNPASEITHLRYELKTAQKVQVALNDITGRMLFDVDQGLVQAGRYDVAIPLNNLATGIYLVTVITPTGKQTIKLDVRH
ncbi:T9SS type A sorting domain-containing protein [Chitinophagaceae bacterium MMS25-I14]